MAATATTRLRIKKVGIGEELNLWGASLNADFDLIDSAIAGLSTIALTGNYSLTSTNYAADEARSALLKFTGAGPWTVTIPSVSKSYLIWNACTGAVTITTGAGTTVVIDAAAKVAVFCDGSNVGELGYAGYGLKAYIDSAVLAATGSLPAVTGNAGKFLYCDGATWAPRTPVAADISDFNAKVDARAIAFAIAF